MFSFTEMGLIGSTWAGIVKLSVIINGATAPGVLQTPNIAIFLITIISIIKRNVM